MKKITLALLALMLGMMAFAQEGLPKDRSSLDNPPEGYVDGLFTVNEFGTQVYFSQGNLQYAEGEWRFAEHQWDLLGDNGQGSAAEDAARDLFGWATSGQGHGATCYQPWSTSQTAQDYYAYGDVGYNLFDESGQADWGSNGIANGGGVAGLWRVPTVEEWNYVFFTRATSSGIRYAKAKVNGVRGVILLPDDWQAGYHALDNTNDGGGRYKDNMVTQSEWESDFESHGAVFLPAAGYRFGTKLYQCGKRGSYFSATSCGTLHAYDICFDDTHLYTGTTTTRRNNGLSVRLVATNASLWYTSVTTGEVTDITSNSATASGTVTTDGGTVLTAVGVCWSTSPGPTIEGDHTDEGALTGDFTSQLTGLERNTTYYVRAYATDGEGDTMYGDEVEFATLPEMPAVTTAEVTEIDITTATVGGEVTDDGGTEVDECGVCWSTEAEPTLDDEHVAAATPGMSAFTVALTGLTQATTYYVCAYVTNSVGTAYGEVVTFTTLPQPYSINVSVNPTAGGTISKDGEAFTGGTLNQGDACELTATPNEGYDFVNWSENGTPVSTDPTYSFEVAGDRNLVANFQLKTYTINVSVDPEEGGAIYVGNDVFTGGNIDHGTQLTMVAVPNEGYAFVNWTEGVDETGAPHVVSTEASYTVNVITTHTLVAHFESTGPEGALKGVFTVRENYQIYFSKGNLQYVGSATAPYWKFADHQWECLSDTTGQNSDAQNVDRDLFGWGTSGYEHGAVCYQPWSTSKTNSDYYAYGSENYHLFDRTGMADWGFNAISNGGNTENSGWRTLTHEEWNYLFNTRNPNGIRYVKAVVNGVNGVILLPDDWDTDYYELSDPNNGWVNYNVNIISSDDWATLERKGAVFLPVAGYRNGASVQSVGSQGQYWSASYNNSSFVWILYFDNNYFSATNISGSQYEGRSVRLVRPIQEYSFTINASANPEAGGTVSGAGDYTEGASCTLTATPNEGYTFINWTEGVDDTGTPKVVSTEQTYTFRVMDNHNLVANFELAGPVGALKGVFSVRENYQIYFSKGNLQYIGSATTPYWKFADHQWECLSDTTGQNSDAQNVDRDLFGWGTSGYNHGAVCYQPWGTSDTNSDYYAYGSESYNLFDGTGQADWGCNAISNGGNQANNGWRTLTHEEWAYLFNTRSTTSGIRYAKAQVNGVNGVILLPDDWSSNYYTLSDTNQGDARFDSNSISASQWVSLEKHGAVFLPASGYRNGASVSHVGSYGYYWSASYSNSRNAWNVCFYDVNLNTDINNGRGYGFSVRLVRSIYSFTISASANPEAGGTVSGAGSYTEGVQCTLTATPNEGYTFINWTEGVDNTGTPKVVSTEQTYTFRVMDNRNLVANFALPEGIINGQFSINADGAKVFFSKGNLQYIGSAATPYWKFAENQWDYFGTTTNQNSDAQTVDRDLFGWGTSGYDHGAVCYQPWSTNNSSSNYYVYGDNSYHLFDQSGQADWGCNAISNGGNQQNNGWRTLTHKEWAYLFNTRSTNSGIRYVKANVNSINGVILLPDDWSSNYYTLSNINQSGASFASNTITASQWNTLEQHGAVFLPAAGRRNGTSVNFVGFYGSYWSASCNGIYYAWSVRFYGDDLNTDINIYRDYGQSVRLVRSSQ